MPQHLFKTILMLASLLPAAYLHAQERAAGGALETQMTWSALSSQVKAVDGKVGALDSKLNMVAECGKNGKIYAPGAPGNVNGCIPAAVDMTLVNNIIACGDSAMIYDKSSNSCVPASTNTTCSSVVAATIGYMQNCPAGTIPTGYTMHQEGGGDSVTSNHLIPTLCMRVECK